MARDPATDGGTPRLGSGGGAGGGAVDEYLALQIAAVDRIAHSGLEASVVALADAV